MIEAYLGLGSNLHNPIAQVLQAVSQLKKLPKTQVQSMSSLYRTKPIGIIPQPDFINAVVKIQTLLTPQEVLIALLSIEQDQGRVRELKWGPRTLDCDLLLYGQNIIQQENLSVPHPHMQNRCFVLLPLAEITPHLVLPNGDLLSDLLVHCEQCSVEKI